MTTLAMLVIWLYIAVAGALYRPFGGWVSERWPVVVLVVALGILAIWVLT